MRHIPDPVLRQEYRRRIGRFLRERRNPGMLQMFLIKCLMHYHHYTAARKLAAGLTPVHAF
jgi:hypothetical protein